MKFLRNYDIDIIRLQEGRHSFSFKVTDEFFRQFEDNNLVAKGDLVADVVLNKEANHIEALFNINGTVELTCDRSLELFDSALETDEKIMYKYGLEEREVNEEIYIITRDTTKLQMAQLIYEFILLALPAKKIHPDYVGEMDEDDFDQEGKLVYVSKPNEKESEEASSESGEADPRWDILKNLRKKD